MALAGISSTTGSASNVLDLDGIETASNDDGGFLRAVDDTDDLSDLVDDNEDDELADVISIDADLSDDDGAFGGTFLAEVRAATDDDDVTLAPENEDSDRFLSELRGIADDAPDDLDSDVADRFFEDD